MNRMYVFIMFLLLSLSAFAIESTIPSSTSISLLAQFSFLELLWMSLTICLAVFFLIKFDRFAVLYGAEILTTMGIVGCFACIACALLHFNSNNMTASIPSLLEGIKTAFCASFIGVVGALGIRIRHKFSKGNFEAAGKVVAEDSLLSQVKLLRQDSNEQQKKLLESFDNFAKQMTENNQKAFIEALKQAITDFNQNLTTQFGDNFKHLNQAVEKLVIWQKQYQEELDVIRQYQSQFTSDMKQASEAFGIIVNHAQQFTEISQNLKCLLESMDKQKDVLFIQEKALSELLISMKEHIPDFSENTRKMIVDISDGVKHVQAETAEIIKNHGAQLQSAQAEMKSVLIDGINKSQYEINASLQENARIIKEGVLALDKELEKSLTDSLTSLGRQLASLSEKFVHDYLPLTERLREVVRLAQTNRVA